MKLRSLFGLLLIMVMMAILGCGSGGGDGGGVAQPTTATVKIATQGALPAGTVIGGIDATVANTSGIGLSITAADLVLSGVAAGSTLAVNANTADQVRLGLINATGFGTGEFATATYAIAAGNSAVSSDFILSFGAKVIDLNGDIIPGIAVAIASIDIK